MAAMISALLEAVESDVAEQLPAVALRQPLIDLDRDTRALWSSASRDDLGIRLDLELERPWLMGEDLSSGRPAPIPWDLLSLDVCRPLAHDTICSTVGLATGNSITEASVGAAAELLEHHFYARLRDAPGRVLRKRQLDIDSIDDLLAKAVLKHITSRGYTVRLWSLDQAAGIAAIYCLISDLDRPGSPLPPAIGTGCHPDRQIALLRAILEAVQARITLIAGSRDDMEFGDYSNPVGRTLDLLNGALAFGVGPLIWSAVPQHATRGSDEDLAVLLSVAANESSLPLVRFVHIAPQADLAVVHALAPGLADLVRLPSIPLPAAPRRPPAILTRRTGAAVVFVGPSLAAIHIPSEIDIRPPAICGDIAALCREPPSAVGIIDGYFGFAPTVWHKEILDLVSLGVPVFGGASIGALRAAELHTFGMIGVGTIFEAYRDGLIRRDDAVMLCHGPAEIGYPPLSVPLVDAEAALLALDMPHAELRQLQRIVRTMPFAERTWQNCLNAYHARTGQRSSVDQRVLALSPSLKEADARLVVAAVVAARRGPPRQRPPITQLYAAMLATLTPAPSTDHRPDISHARGV